MTINYSVTTLVVAFVIYFLPGIIAEVRKHPQRNPIGVINLFLGWTLLGWVGALAWSVMAIKREPVR